MTTDKLIILERYNRIKHELAVSNIGDPRIKKLKLELAKVMLDMELNDLSNKDFIDFKNKRNKEAQQVLNKKRKTASEKSFLKGIILSISGVILAVAGIGFSELTNGGMVFYGLFFVGITLCILGGIELYAYKISK